jgi:hypothetical protein
MTLIQFKCGNNGSVGFISPDAVASVRTNLDSPALLTDVCTLDGKQIAVQGTPADVAAALTKGSS